MLPKFVDELVLLPRLAYPEPLILLYFPSSVPFLVFVCSGASEILRDRYYKELNFELSLMVTMVLAADYYWTDRCSWVVPAVVSHLGF